MQTRHRVFKHTAMQVSLYFFLDEICKLLTYYTPNRCKVINIEQRSSFLGHPVNYTRFFSSIFMTDILASILTHSSLFPISMFLLKFGLHLLMGPYQYTEITLQSDAGAFAKSILTTALKINKLIYFLSPTFTKLLFATK